MHGWDERATLRQAATFKGGPRLAFARSDRACDRPRSSCTHAAGLRTHAAGLRTLADVLTRLGAVMTDTSHVCVCMYTSHALPDVIDCLVLGDRSHK